MLTPRLGCLCCGHGTPQKAHYYKGCWIEAFVQEDGSYVATVELPQQGGVVQFNGSTWHEASRQAHVFLEESNAGGRIC